MADRPPKKHDPNRLARYVAMAAAEGVAAGWACLLALLWLDVGGFGRLVHGSEDAVTALVILLMSFGVTFGFVGIAWKVMVMLPDEE